MLCLARCCKDKGSLDSIPKHAQRRHDCVEPLIVSLQHKTDGNKKRGQTIAEFLDGKFLDGEGREQPSTEFSPRDDFQKAHGLPPRVKSTRAAQRAVQCGVTQEGNALVRIEVPDGAAEGDEFVHKSIDGSRTCKYRAPAGSGRRVLVAEEPRDNGEIAREFTGAKGAWEAVNGEHPRPIAQWQSGALLLMQNAKESCVDLYCAWRIESLKGLPDWLVQIVERSPIKVGNPVLERLCDLFGNESIKSFLCDHKLSSEEAGLVRLEDDEGITATLIVVRTTAPLKEAISDIDATGMYSYPALTADFVWKALLATRTLPPEGSEQRAAVQRTLAPADLGTSAGDLSLHPTALLYEEMWQRVAQDVNLMADDGTTVAEDLKRKWMERMVQSKVLDYLSTIGEPGCSSTAGGSGKCFLVTVEPAAATASTAAATSADAASAAAAPVVTPVTPTAAASESAPGTSDGQTTQPQIVPAAAGALVPAAKPAVADGTLVTTIKQRLETAVKDAPQEKKRQAQFDAVMTEMVNFDQFKVGNERRKYARDAYLADAEERGIDVREGYWGKSDKIPSDLECFEANGMTANPHGRDWWLAVGLARLSSLAQPGPPRLDIVKAVKGDRKCVLMYALLRPPPLRPPLPTIPSPPTLSLHP